MPLANIGNNNNGVLRTQVQEPQSGGATNNTTNNAKNKVNKYNLKYLFDNIINLDNYVDIVGKKSNTETAKINNQLMLQLKIKNLLVVLIRDVLTQHTAGLRIPNRFI